MTAEEGLAIRIALDAAASLCDERARLLHHSEEALERRVAERLAMAIRMLKDGPTRGADAGSPNGDRELRQRIVVAAGLA